MTTVIASNVTTVTSGQSISDVELIGATLTINAGGTLTNLTEIQSTGVVGITDSGTLVEPVPASATVQLRGTLSGTGVVQQSGPGTLILETADPTFDGTLVIGGGVVELSNLNATDTGIVVAFTPGAAGTLRLDADGLAGYVSGFAAGDAIDLQGLTFGGTAAATVSGNTVKIVEGGQSATIVIAGAAPGGYALFDDGAGGTELAVAGSVAPPTARTVVGTARNPLLLLTSGQSASNVEVLSGGRLVIGAGASVTGAVLQQSAAVTDNGTLTLSEAAGQIDVFAGILSGSGVVQQTGPGTLYLDAPTSNTFSGTVVIGGGVLVAPGQLGSATVAFTAGQAGTLQFAGTTTIAGFALGDRIDVMSRFNGYANVLVNGNSVGAGSFYGTISGAASDNFRFGPDGSGGTQLALTLAVPVLAGTTLTVSSGQTSSFLAVQGGATLQVLGGGIVTSAAVSGNQTLLGTDSFGFVSSGAVQTISSGGRALGTTILHSGSAVVSAGGLASGTAIYGQATVLSGGTVSGAAVYTSVTQGSLVGLSISGGRAVDTTIFNSLVNVGGFTTGSGASAQVKPGIAIGTVITGLQNVFELSSQTVTSGGITSGTMVLNGFETVYSGGLTSGTTVFNGGSELVTGGVAIDTTVMAGGFSIDAGTAVNPILPPGYVFTDSGTVIYTEAAGTTRTFNGGLVFLGYLSPTPGTLVQSGPGTLVLAGDLSSFYGTVAVAGGTLELTSAGAAGRAYRFGFQQNSIGTLRIDGAASLAKVISGAGGGDIVDLAGLGFAGTTAPTISGNTLTVTEGAASQTLTFASIVGDTFTLANDGAGGTNVLIACYCRGTLILTDAGETAVEALAIGDTVITASGMRPVRWIGRRSYAGRFLAANPGVQPVRFRAGSLGDGLPRRDLLVSPEHAMFLDGLLVPARCLLNGSTITQERCLKRVDYYHVELDSHDVILAEGAQSESYLDDDSRGMFHNTSEFAALYPNATESGWFCARKVDDGYELETIRRRLAAVAGEMVQAA